MKTPFDSWIEIFRVGSYGAKGNWTREMLQKVVQNLKAGIWKPPAVLGHPESDSPAMGWVEDLTLDGDVLKARFGQVQPELVEHVNSGRYTNRSVAFYLGDAATGPVLRHVGFLGAMPPQVKGLAPIRFSEAQFAEIDFLESYPAHSRVRVATSDGSFPGEPVPHFRDVRIIFSDGSVQKIRLSPGMVIEWASITRTDRVFQKMAKEKITFAEALRSL